MTALRLTGLSKTFGGSKALDDVSLEVAPGTVHAVLGGNGSGKSTLVKILAGVHTADPGGHLEVGGHRARAERFTAHRSRAWGLRFVHQDLGLIGEATVAENIALTEGFPRRGGGIAWRSLHRDVDELLERFDVAARAQDRLDTLSPATRTMVAVARALRDPAGSVLVLDEPTASLPPREVEILLGALRRSVAKGRTIVYVGHRLEEVLALADDITVLRDGRRAGTLARAEVDERTLIELITGGTHTTAHRPAIRADGDEVLAVAGHQVELSVAAGEVVGLAGLADCGARELLQAVHGQRPGILRSMRVDGKAVRPRTPAQAISAGISYVPPDRLAQASFPDLSVRDNLTLPLLRRYWSHGRIRGRHAATDADRLARRFAVRAPSLTAPFGALSGGNQQKVVVARALETRPRVLLLDEPTQGVDVGARRDIHTAVRGAAEEGAAVLVASTDFHELAELCDRVVVLHHGRPLTEATAPGLSAHALLTLLQSALEEALV